MTDQAYDERDDERDDEREAREAARGPTERHEEGKPQSSEGREQDEAAPDSQPGS
jgi:hypothetical protein